MAGIDQIAVLAAVHLALPHIDIDQIFSGRDGRGERGNDRHPPAGGQGGIVVQGLAGVTHGAFQHGVHALDQDAARAQGGAVAALDIEVVGGARGGQNAEAVVAAGHAVAGKPFQKGLQFKLADILLFVPVGIYEWHALLQADTDIVF